MRHYWIVPGSEKNWRQALISKGIWGLEDKLLDRVYWLALAADDVILFYVSGKVKGIVGYGVVRGKFRQDVPLWDAELREGRVRWPLRFEFDIEYILTEDRWAEDNVHVSGGGHFRQPLLLKDWHEIEPAIRELNPTARIESLHHPSTPVPPAKHEEVCATHDEIKTWLREIGRLQGYVADLEFPMGPERLDTVWRRLPESVPTFVFEVQVGGDLYHAMGKLKHAHDLWNSRIFLVASPDELGRVKALLSGTFHEIESILRFIPAKKVEDLRASKLNIYRIERELGLIP